MKLLIYTAMIIGFMAYASIITGHRLSKEKISFINIGLGLFAAILGIIIQILAGLKPIYAPLIALVLAHLTGFAYTKTRKEESLRPEKKRVEEGREIVSSIIGDLESRKRVEPSRPPRISKPKRIPEPLMRDMENRDLEIRNDEEETIRLPEPKTTKKPLKKREEKDVLDRIKDIEEDWEEKR